MNEAREFSSNAKDNDFEPYADILSYHLKKPNNSPLTNQPDYYSGHSSKENENSKINNIEKLKKSRLFHNLCNFLQDNNYEIRVPKVATDSLRRKELGQVSFQN